MVELSGGRHRGVEGTTAGEDPLPPVILALLFMIRTTGVRQDRSDLLRAAYNRKCAASCVFEVVLTCAQIIKCLCDCSVMQNYVTHLITRAALAMRG